MRINEIYLYSAPQKNKALPGTEEPASERFPFSGTVPEDGAFLKFSVRNIGGNVDNLRAVWLNTHFAFLFYPAHFVEHGSKVV